MKVFHNYYYTFDETFPNSGLMNNLLLFYGSVPGWYSTLPTNKKQWLDEVYKRVVTQYKRKGWYFTYSETDYDLSVSDDIIAFTNENYGRINDFFETFRETMDKYFELITQQANLKADIVKELENVQLHYYHDTPETESSTGYINEDYTSNMSRDVQKIDLGPVSEKLNEVERAMRDIYEEWSKLFRRFRIMEA